MFFLAFPSWEEGANDVLCAKFIYFYEPKCFRNHTNIIMQEILNLQGVQRLQGTFITKNYFIFVIFVFICRNLLPFGTCIRRLFEIF